MVAITEAAIKFSSMSPDSIPESRVVDLRERTVYSRHEINKDPKNPNSYIRVLSQCPPEKKHSRAMGVLMNLLKEPIFTQLRTKEQLGYIVNSAKIRYSTTSYAMIGIQSSTKDADFLEHRINELLLRLKDNWPFTDADVRKVVDAMINAQKQEHTSLQREFASHWQRVSSQKKEFNVRHKTIAKLEVITHEQVRDLFLALFFENPRRLNYKSYKPDSESNQEAIKSN